MTVPTGQRPGLVLSWIRQPIKMLVEAEKRARRLGGELWVAALNPAVKQMVRRSSLGSTLGPERMFYDLEHAVESFRSVRVQKASPR